MCFLLFSTCIKKSDPLFLSFVFFFTMSDVSPCEDIHCQPSGDLFYTDGQDVSYWEGEEVDPDPLEGVDSGAPGCQVLLPSVKLNAVLQAIQALHEAKAHADSLVEAILRSGVNDARAESTREGVRQLQQDTEKRIGQLLYMSPARLLLPDGSGWVEGHVTRIYYPVLWYEADNTEPLGIHALSHRTDPSVVGGGLPFEVRGTVRGDCYYEDPRVNVDSVVTVTATRVEEPAVALFSESTPAPENISEIVPSQWTSEGYVDPLNPPTPARASAPAPIPSAAPMGVLPLHMASE